MQPMNINITTSDKNSTVNDSSVENLNDEYTELKNYVIKNINNLTIDNKQLRKRIVELEKENADYEKENDKYDERIRYMRGLLHNLYSLKQMNSDIRKEWEKYSNNHNRIFNKYLTIEKYITKVFQTYIFVLFLISTFEEIIFGTYYVFIKILFYNFTAIFTMYFLINKKYILKNDLFFFNWKNNNLTIEFVEDIKNINIIQSELMKTTKTINKEVENLENACVGVSVMIDNI